MFVLMTSTLSRWLRDNRGGRKIIKEMKKRDDAVAAELKHRSCDGSLYSVVLILNTSGAASSSGGSSSAIVPVY